ncbi:hypothetical protein [Flavobacterium sp. HJJ]|uniref:hypothetical protein n=1 Tax=Flavobacterium sp. HJJ TaxID=2783792 RepID=UPI00188D3076|nr:hypothetical protein [Flavobacterium sp. HJJ]MBF4471398.1 hypothetical protein [Flavobacterium sp. HJJ]
MNIKENLSILRKYLLDLNYTTSYDTSKNADKPYFAKNLKKLRSAIRNLEDIAILNQEIEMLKNSSLFSNNDDENLFGYMDNNIISGNVATLTIGIEFLLRYGEQIAAPIDGLNIRLPEIENFDDLSRVSNSLKKALELPINDQNKGYLKIEGADSGSVWITVSVGSMAAVNLIAAICWAAAVVRKKMAEAKMFEEHAKTLTIKNEILGDFVNAQKEQLKNILEAEAKQIANEHYSIEADSDAVGRLKLSISTVSDLIDKGGKILPTSDSNDTIKLFPDYSNLNMIESSIRQLKKS